MAYLQISGKNLNAERIKAGIVLFLLIFLSSTNYGQVAQKDYAWWNILHGWETGDPNWRAWMISSPGYLGPNALPVPDVKRGILEPDTELELTFSAHHYPGDPTHDVSGRIYIPFSNNRIAFEMYGVIAEKYNYTEQIRNERFSRDEDGRGWVTGDFYFSTLIQLVRDKVFPDMLLRLACKTASGDMEAARYTDTPGYFFDLSISKALHLSEQLSIRPYGSVGFYCWQTYDESNPQNDAYMYSAGADLSRQSWLLSASCSGYSGYKKEKDKPLQLNFGLRKDLERTAFRVQYLHGLRDWEYKTVKVSVIFKLDPVH